MYKYITNNLFIKTSRKGVDTVTLHETRDNDITEEIALELKKCVDVSQMKTLLNQYVKQGGIKTVDKFISKSHGRSLVQHRYIAEQKTILIVDECHEALSSNRRVMTTTETFDDQTSVEKNYNDFRKRTKTYFRYGKNTIANILVSATPMLADNPFKQLRIIAKFLNRETEFYGIGHSKGKYVRKEDTLKFEPYPLLDKSCDAITVNQYGDKYNEERIARRYVKYREVIDSLRGKLTRVQYILNDEEFDEEMAKQGIDTYVVKNPNEEKKCKTIEERKDYVGDGLYLRYRFNKELKKYERLPKVQLTEHIMQQYLYGTPSFLSKRYWAQSENGMVQNDRLAIVKNALKSLYLFRKNTFESPFPIKIPVNNGYTTFERDIVRKYLSEHRGTKNILKRRMIPDMTTVYLSKPEKTKYVFHENLSKGLQERYKKIKGFYPVVVTIMDHSKPDERASASDKLMQSDAMYVMQQLQEMAFSVSDKWIVVLNIPGNLDKEDASNHVLNALKHMHIGKYEKERATKGAKKLERKPFENCNHDILTEQLKNYLNTDNGRSNIKWLRLREGDGISDHNDSIVSIPGVLSSRIEKIVLRIEECIANNKNVLVYNNNIEVLKAIEFGLKARRNRRVHLQDIYDQDPNSAGIKQWIREQKAKIYRKWSQWNPHNRQLEIDLIEQKTQFKDIEEDKEQYEKDLTKTNRVKKPRPPASLNRHRLKEIIRNALGRLRDHKDEIKMKKPYEYVAALNESKRIMGMYKIKNPTFKNIEGYWDTEEKGLVREKDEPWGYIPQTHDQYISYTLYEFSNKEKQKTSIIRIKSAITKHILQGKDEIVPTEDALFKGFHFYFKSIRQFEQAPLDNVLTLCQVFMNGFIKKNIRGEKAENKFLAKLRQVEECLDKRYAETYSFTNNAVNDFFEFCIFYYQTSMKDATTDRKSSGGANWWTDRLTTQVLNIWRKDMTETTLKEKTNYLNLKRSCKKRLKNQDNGKKNGIYYLLPKTYVVSPSDVALLKKISKDIDPKMYIKDIMSDGDLIEAAQYLFDVFNTEKIQEIKHEFGMQKFPVGGASFASYMYMSPTNKAMIYGAVYDKLEEKRKQQVDEIKLKIKELKKVISKEKREMKKEKQEGVFFIGHQVELGNLQDRLKAIKTKFKKIKDGPDDTTMKTMYNILKQGVALDIPESAPAVSQFIQKYERLQKLSTFGTYRFSTPDDFIDKINYLQNDVSKTNHTFSINKWNFVDTCTFMGEYFSDKQMTATQSDLDFIEETKDQKAAEPKPINYGGQNNVPGRLRKSYQWQKRRNAYLRPHPLNSTVARQVLKDNLKEEISSIDTNELKFSCLRQNINEDTYENVKKRVLSQKDDFSISKVSFGMLTGKHTPRDDDRELYKLAFECGMIDCLLMNKVCITGIDFESTRESECIISVCEKLPGVHDQFVGRLVRRNSHATCPKEFRRVSYNTFQETISTDDKRYVVTPYHLLPSKSEGGLFDVSDKASSVLSQRGTTSMSLHRGLVHHLHEKSDSEWDSESDYSSSDDEDLGVEEDDEDLKDVLNNAFSESRQNRDEIKEILLKIMSRLGWSDETNPQLIQQLIDEVKVKYEGEIRRRNAIEDKKKFMEDIFLYYNTRRERFTPLDISENEVEGNDTALFDHISYLTREFLWRRRKVYYNISVVPVFNNHAFYSPYELLESGLQYEYGPRLWVEKKQRDELDQGGLQIDYKWCCYVCNYESSNPTECEKCHARNLMSYYKMEPFYLDHDLELEKNVGNHDVDARDKKIFEHNRMVLNQTNLDLSMQSIEHVGKMRKDMIVQVDTEKMRYYQRIKNDDQYTIDNTDSAIDIIYKSNPIDETIETKVSENVLNYESDTPSIQSEYED